MIEPGPATSLPDNLARRLGRILLAELPSWQLFVIAAAIGLLWAASLFDWSFIAGRHPFWQFPMGMDMQVVVAAYLYYLHSPWCLPIFYVSALGAPTGTNIIFTDVVPIVALFGKLIHSLTGATVNLYGAYLFLCFALPGVMMTLVLIISEIRCALAAIIGAVFANAMPALLWRWGDIALQAQFLLIRALALYLFSQQQRARCGLAAAWIGYLALTYLTNIYLFAMVGAVWLCAVVQRRLNGRATTREALATGTLTVALILILIIASGQFGAGGGLPFAEYGQFSMNLLSPFVPQQSGLFPQMGGVIDATDGQYEGFNYLGMGLLLVSLLLLPAVAVWLRRNARRHTALLIAFALLTVFAISNRVFAGHWLLLTLPMPRDLNQFLGIFRSSGRFFWVIGYAQIALVVVLVFRRPRPVIVLYLLAAAFLQLIDIQPLRAHIIASIAAGPGEEDLDRNQVARLVARARHLDVVPSFQCSVNAKQISANMELMLAASRVDVPTNTVYLARQSYGLGLREVLGAPSHEAQMLRARRSKYCRHEIQQARNGGGPGDVLVLLANLPRPQQMAPNVICSPLAWARYCEGPRK